jgi:hypothetical protein
LRRLHHDPCGGGAQARRDAGELAEALGVAVSINAGAAVVYSTRTFDAFKSPEEA